MFLVHPRLRWSWAVALRDQPATPQRLLQEDQLNPRLAEAVQDPAAAVLEAAEAVVVETPEVDQEATLAAEATS
jgi:hypothetical protein